MAQPFFNLDLKEKIDFVKISPYEWSKNLIALGFKSKIVVGIIKFQEEFDDLDQEVELEVIEEFFHGPRVHSIAWSPTSSMHKLPYVLQLCVAGSDCSLRILSSDLTKKEHSRREIEGHDDYINECCYDREGEYLASVSDDLTCKLWDSANQFQLVATLNLTSPGMSVCWHEEQPHKLLVGEKNGIFRMYSTLTLTPIISLGCSPSPLVQVDWSSANHISFLAAGILHRAQLLVPGHMIEDKTVHPEGGYSVSVCPANHNYIATVGRPNNSLKITNIKTKLTLLATHLKLFGGLSWHSRLPVLCVGNNSSLSIYKISLK